MNDSLQRLKSVIMNSEYDLRFARRSSISHKEKLISSSRDML